MKSRITIICAFISLCFCSYLTFLTYRVYGLKSSYPVYNDSSQSYELLHIKPKHWILNSEISKVGKWAIIVSEDWAFYDHSGLDLNQLEIVLRESIKEGRLVRGASTITQQVIKNSLLSNEKTIYRKVSEAYMSFVLEKIMTKEQILEIYLNIIHLGEDLYGIKNAAKFYFGKSAKNLNAREGAFLAMLLPSPVKYSISFKNKELTEFALNQIDEILIKLRQAKVISDAQRLKVLTTPLKFEKISPLEHSRVEDYF